MNMPCEFESAVVAALRHGSPDERLRKHIETCPHCQETARLVRQFHTLAADTDMIAPPIPDLSSLIPEFQPVPVRRSQAGLYALIAVILGVVMYAGSFLYRLLSHQPDSISSAPLRLPLPGSPFPSGSGLLLVIVALALVLFLPKLGKARPRNFTGTMVSF